MVGGFGLEVVYRGFAVAKEVEDIYAWSNVVTNNWSRGFESFHNTGTYAWGSDNTHFYNNTLYNNGYDSSTSNAARRAGEWIYDNKPSGLGIFSKNNIISNSSYSPWFLAGSFNGTNVTLDYNLLYHPSGGVNFVWGGDVLYPLTQT